MILAILQHTPVWVFVVFAALVALGVQRLRTNTIGLRRLLVLPIAMTGFSLFGLTQSFGFGLVPLVAWSAAFAALLAFGASRSTNAAVQYFPETRSVRVPGSAVPLALMMTIFFLRYAVAVTTAMHPALHDDASFVAGIAALYGLSSGAFAARALITWRSAFTTRTTIQPLAAA